MLKERCATENRYLKVHEDYIQYWLFIFTISLSYIVSVMPHFTAIEVNQQIILKRVSVSEQKRMGQACGFSLNFMFPDCDEP